MTYTVVISKIEIKHDMKSFVHYSEEIEKEKHCMY